MNKKESVVLAGATLSFFLIHRQTPIHFPRPRIHPSVQVFDLPEPRPGKQFQSVLLPSVPKPRTIYLNKRTVKPGEKIMTDYNLHYLEQINQEIKDTPEEYLPALLNIVRSYRQSVALNPADASFRQGWAEVLQGETLPINELWVGINEQ